MFARCLKEQKLAQFLNPHELVAVSSTLYASRKMKNFFVDMPSSLVILAGYVANITVLRNVENAIENIVNEQGTIRDDASVELLKIRREIRIISGACKG